MSGGRFQYVCYDMDDAEHAYRATFKLMEMRDHCAGQFPEAVPHIEDMLSFLHAFNEEYAKRGVILKDLLKAVEWNASSDWGEERVYKALAELEGQQ